MREDGDLRLWHMPRGQRQGRAVDAFALSLDARVPRDDGQRDGTPADPVHRRRGRLSARDARFQPTGTGQRGVRHWVGWTVIERLIPVHEVSLEVIRLDRA